MTRLNGGAYHPDRWISHDAKPLGPSLVRRRAAGGVAPAGDGWRPVAGRRRQAEEARRKQQPKPAKVYTNQDLKRDQTTPTPAAARRGAGRPAHSRPRRPRRRLPPSRRPAPTPGPRSGLLERSHDGAAREQLERSQTFAAALQSRIDALTLDFVNRDDPAQRSVIEQNRLKALAELERVQREIASQTKAITAIEDEARKAGVPAGWLR